MFKVTGRMGALVLGVLMMAGGSTAVSAGQIKGSLPQNPCALFYQLQKNRSFDVVKVQIINDQKGLVDVMILGLPRKVQVTLNGMDVSRQKADSRQIVCGREAVGEFARYDLSAADMDAGFFEIKAGQLGDSRSIQIK